MKTERRNRLEEVMAEEMVGGGRQEDWRNERRDRAVRWTFVLWRSVESKWKYNSIHVDIFRTTALESKN